MRLACYLAGTPLHYNDSEQIVLSAYRMFDKAPIRFAESLTAQVNWGYDIGHNVPANLCPPPPGSCPISYDILSYLYLAEPADASASKVHFPWSPLGEEPKVVTRKTTAVADV